MSLTLLLQHSFLYGLLLSVLLSTLFVGGALLSPDVLLRSYPPDIKERYGAMSAKGQRYRRVMAPLLLLILFGVSALTLWSLAQTKGADLTWGEMALSLGVAFLTFNLVDLVVLDWLVFVRWQPKFVVLPGTEGLAGYNDYGFHFRAFLRGLVIITVFSLLIAGVAFGIQAVL